MIARRVGADVLGLRLRMPGRARQEPRIRRHIRKCFWLRWHNSKGRVRHLRRLGIPPGRVDIGRSSRGAWRMARHAVVQEALSNRRLRQHQFLLPSDLAR